MRCVWQRLRSPSRTFRSTYYNRDALVEIHAGLEQFIAQWEKSFFATNIVGPIYPNADPYQTYHKIARNPFDPTQRSLWLGGSPSIALGCIDPVSGIAILEPEYRDGFAVHLETHESFKGGVPANKFWVLDNYDQAIANAEARQGAMMTELRARCGIHSFIDLKDSVFSLMNLTGSEFVDLTDATFFSDQLRLMNPVENLDLGIIGYFAGKGGKQYPAHRYRQHIVKKFRIPMARRTDVSRMQLGYRMVVGVDGGEANIVLCDFSKLNSPLQTVDFFPSGTRVATITAPDAVVYDVIQSEIFSIAEEDAFEVSGLVAGKRRIYVNPRAGAVNLQIKVTFDFNINDNDHPFFGFANVEVSSGGVDANADGFIASIDVYETLPPEVGTNGPPREQDADHMRLHFGTSFLVAPGDYFTDRDAGYAEADRVFHDQKYAKSATVGAIDPIATISRQAQVETAVSAFAETQLREHPRQMEAILGRLQVREPSTH